MQARENNGTVHYKHDHVVDMNLLMAIILITIVFTIIILSSRLYNGICMHPVIFACMGLQLRGAINLDVVNLLENKYILNCVRLSFAIQWCTYYTELLKLLHIFLEPIYPLPLHVYTYSPSSVYQCSYMDINLCCTRWIHTI